jgi:hypothetical protein
MVLDDQTNRAEERNLRVQMCRMSGHRLGPVLNNAATAEPLDGLPTDSTLMRVFCVLSLLMNVLSIGYEFETEQKASS